MDKKQILGLIALAAIAGALWQLSSPEEELEDEQRQLLASDADYYLKEVTYTNLNKSGAKQYQLAAANAEHQSEMKSTVLKTVTLDYQSATQGLWRLSAPKAVVNDIQNIVTLLGGVNVVLQEKLQQSNMDTERLTVYPDQQKAHTITPVKLTHPQGYVTANGLEINLQDGIYTLQGNVKGHYEITTP